MEGARRLPKRTAEAGRLVQDVPYEGPTWGLFLRAEVHSRRCRHSEFVAAKRHFESEAACELRTAGPLGQFTE